jgi:Ca2+-binding EF-hand superfamily protein
MKINVFTVCVVAMAVVASGSVLAQGRGRGGDRGGNSGGRYGGGPQRGSGDRGSNDRGSGRGPSDRDSGDRGRDNNGGSRSGPTPSPGSSPTRSGSNSSKPGASTSVQGFGNGEKQPPMAPGFNVPLEVPGGNLQDRYDKRVLDRADKEVLPMLDKDKDGFISQDEAKASDWDPPFADSDLDKDGRLSRFELYERYAKKLKLPPKTSVVYNTSGGGTKPADAAQANADHAKVAEYAKGLLNQHDANKNGVLDKDEWKSLSEKYHSADTNKDNVITNDELTVKLIALSSSSTASSSPPSSSTASSSPASGGPPQKRSWWNKDNKPADKNDKTADTRKSYRVLTATERLPKGLPDWFARNDSDADGQVMMSEYLSEKSDSKASDFAKYDLNGDGVITPQECLEVEGKGKKK